MIGKVTGVRYSMGELSIGLTFPETTPDEAQNMYDFYKNKTDVKADIKKKPTRRTLDANAYFHSLCRKLGHKLTMPFGMCKNMLISRYGEPLLTEDGHVAQIYSNAPEKELLCSESIHVWAVGNKGNGTIYNVYRDTHTYNNVEFSKLLNGCISECNEQGIPTDPVEFKEILAKLRSEKT